MTSKTPQSPEHWDYMAMKKASEGLDSRYLSQNELDALERLKIRGLITIRIDLNPEGYPTQRLTLTKEGKELYEKLKKEKALAFDRDRMRS